MASLTEEVKRMIQSALESMEVTSANPVHTNTLKQVNSIDTPDLDAIVNESSQTPDLEVKQDKQLKDTILTVETFKKGNVGAIGKMGADQFSNIKQLATNPFSFMVGTMLRKLKSGAGVLFITAIAVEVAKFLILELFKPGRIFDQRFRERIDEQVIKFLDRKEQQELRQGFKTIITTTIGGLRGDTLRGQLGGNFYSGGQFNVAALAYDPSRISRSNFNALDNRKKSFQSVGVNAARSGRGGGR